VPRHSIHRERLLARSASLAARYSAEFTVLSYRFAEDCACRPDFAGFLSDCGLADVGQRHEAAGSPQDSKAIPRGLSYEKYAVA